MTTITINRPLELNMELVEIDEHVPSFRMSIAVLIKHPTGVVTYQANDIWFENRKWDSFINQLKSSHNQVKISLCDISDFFELTIRQHQNQLFFEIKVEEPETGSGSIRIFYSREIDLDILAQVKERFLDFYSWW
ncbi:hypothetical protein [Xanthocytophaga flava]|uniref:hypothetical protein n=1 Tax=Xanthocytophaga flava TaxID=3048013 RepID=UPI0028D377DC|nr:hypothetical protein [Xanthocytophaga flavus]MDJ1471148.1 hypothetical protein [Xanthocytophaga flavus]